MSSCSILLGRGTTRDEGVVTRESCFSTGSQQGQQRRKILLHRDFRLPHAYSFPADDPHRQSVYDCISLYWLAPEQDHILSFRGCPFAQITKTCWH